MKTSKYFLISILAILVCSCKDAELSSTQPTPGQEVKLGAILEKNVSRTIYGDSVNGAYPIYWVDGDEVLVFSPDCASRGGVGSANYKVNVGENTQQNYANSLDKTGDIGVRWGNDTGSASFYSIYPASSLYTKLSSDCKTLTLTMPVQQDNNFERVTGSDGKEEIVARPDMRACFMYAYTPDVPSGDIVNLKYKPLTTAIRFKLLGPMTGDPVTINYVRVYAPEGTSINGTFVFKDVTQGTGIPDAINGLNYVTMNVANAHTGAYLELGPGESVDLNIFLLLGKRLTIGKGWYIEVGSASGKSYKISLESRPGSEGNSELIPGMVHQLPNLPPLKSEAWDVKDWMRNLQRNVYLSEISIPGSWNSLNGEYQQDFTSITSQYNIGVRAFHLDTRWKKQLLADNVLAIANGGRTVGTDGNKYMSAFSGAPTFESTLKTIVENVAPEEYMVVMCTFAQGSADYKYEGSKNWIYKISEICNTINSSSDVKYKDKIVDGSQLKPTSVVADVLGKVIVIVNTYTKGDINDSRCLFMDMGMALDETEFKNNDYYDVPLKWFNSTESGIRMFATYAQITTNKQTDTEGTDQGSRGYAPTLLERKNKAENILNKSKQNYANVNDYTHSAWMYLGLGGYVDNDNPEPVNTYFKNWIGDKITEMYTNDSYYPIGLVFFNYVSTLNNPNTNESLAREILEMNNKYRKAYDPNRSPVDGSYINNSNGGGTNNVQSAAPGYSSGMIDNNTDAIGWTRSK